MPRRKPGKANASSTSNATSRATPAITATATAAATPRSKKRELGVTNPLDFAPHEYNRAIFKCNYPLVRLCSVMPADDKFAGLRMKRKTLVKALSRLLKPATKVSRVYGIKSELEGRKLHTALFENLYFFTKPSQISINRESSLERGFDFVYPPAKRTKITSSTVADVVAMAEAAAAKQRASNKETENVDFAVSKQRASNEETENVDFLITEGEEQIESVSGSDRCFQAEEETAPDVRHVQGEGRIDIKIFVYNKSNGKLKIKFGHRDDVDPRKCVCICESKWDKETDDNALMQAAAHACQQALANLGNLHFTPIYILALTRTNWTYGILDCRGCVKVRDGIIDKQSLQSFSLHESMRFSCDPLCERDLEQQLKEATSYLQSCYFEMPNAVYPNGTCLVGNLHVSGQWFQLPTFDAFNGQVHEHVYLFYEGLLRIIIGDKVNDWELEDLQAAEELRDSLLEITERMLLGSHYVMLPDEGVAFNGTVQQ